MTGDARMIVEAFAFASHAHADQKRDDMGDSYLVHLAEVAASCARHEPFDPELVAAAILHDTIEDTPVTADDLRQKFGDEITGVVLEVTDAPGVERRDKQAVQSERMKTASVRARLLKLADKTSNVAELADLPPGRPPPPPEEMRAYVHGARRVVEQCRGLDADLEAAFDAAASRVDALIAKLENRKVEA
jgi:(p)ppGpp synthase/HD superfamily hydrolase